MSAYNIYEDLFERQVDSSSREDGGTTQCQHHSKTWERTEN